MSGTKAKAKEKGRGNGRVKRREVESEDGWTVITHGISNINLNGKDKKKPSTKNVAGKVPATTVKDLTVAKLAAEFADLQTRWKTSHIAQQLDDMDCKVDEAVCIGIGSFSRDWEHRWRSLWQLVLFVHVSSSNKSASSTTRMYAQDPAFTALDTAFLRSLGFDVVATGIESHISSDAFVFSPFVDWFILLPVFLRGRDPVLYIGNEVLDDYGAFADSEGKRGKVGECNELGKIFLRERHGVKVREFEFHAHAFNGMVVYTRTPT